MNILIKKLYSIIEKFPILPRFITEEFMRYFVIGFSSFLITYSVSNAIYFGGKSVFDLNEMQESILASMSFIVAYLVSFSFNFTMTRKWTFKIEGPKLKSQLIKFFIVHACSALVSSALVGGLNKIGLPPFLSVPLVTGIQMITSFVLYKTWVFRNS